MKATAVTGCLLLLIACGGPRPEPGTGLRLVSLVPSVTEMVYVLGAGERLVGNTNSCDWPEEARQVPKVGNFYQPDLERIVSLRPDIVFLALPIHRPAAEKLGELGIRYYASDPQSFAGLFAEVESVGRIVGRAVEAESLVRAMTGRIAGFTARPDTPRVYIEISDRPLMSAGRGSFIDEAIRLAGGRNIFGDLDHPYPVIAPEDVVLADPEVIVLSHPGIGPEELRTRLGWAGITAVRERRVFADIDEDLLMRPGPRAIAGIEQLRERLHRGCWPRKRGR